MREVVVSGLVTGWAIAVPIGAVGAYLVALTARTSWRTGAAAALGIASVDGAYAALAVVAGTALSALLAPAQDALRTGSGLVLLVVAALMARGALRPALQSPGARDGADPEVVPLRPRTAYALFVGITAVNPTTVVYFAAVVLGRDLTDGAAEGTVFVVAALVASASWQLLLAGGGALLGRAVTGPHGRLLTGLGSAVVVAGLALHTMVG
ncbi:LysE family transporter [Nocardioides deserti]|uniref:LysE family transporter n=1 Tax=Nocardioides deserti TaxID=1588644 RepID=A0ABR6UB22_9ACTN|nr:LysE family transporter [Nocardioides deserti]MBC2961558.1 LysE family transporter [Nocardioides deserti]GGO78169.1 lysine transporter LysE [Nocardioides deserti]